MISSLEKQIFKLKEDSLAIQSEINDGILVLPDTNNEEALLLIEKIGKKLNIYIEKKEMFVN